MPMERVLKFHQKERESVCFVRVSVCFVRVSVCVHCSEVIWNILTYSSALLFSRSKKHRKKVESSSESESEGGEEEEGVWVEKKIKRDANDAFVGPVPEIKVQTSVNKKE